MTGTLAVLRFPRQAAQAKGRYGVTSADGAPVMAIDVTDRGRQVDVTAPDGRPLGRILAARGRAWQLLAPGTGQPVAAAETRWGVQVSIGAGPWAKIEGRGDEWDLVWEKTVLLAVRRTPRRVARRSLDVYVDDASCTPAVVALVVHVRRWWVDAEATDQIIIQQTLT